MPHHEPPFTGIWPAMVTPFDDQDRVHLPAARQLVARFIDEGAGGIYLCGSSGEGPLLRAEERIALTECVIAEAGGQIPIMVHVGHTAPAIALDLARHAGQCGADAISATYPPFYAYSAEQVAEYWGTLTQAAELPFYGYVMHDLGNARHTIEHWVETMNQVPHFAGIKFTSEKAQQLAVIKACTQGSWNLFSGSDENYLACRIQGAEGAIGTTYNVALPLFKAVAQAFEARRIEEATRRMIDCCDLIARLLTGHFLTRVKLVMRKQGVNCGLTRPPLRPVEPIPQAEIDELAHLIAARTQMRVNELSQG